MKKKRDKYTIGKKYRFLGGLGEELVGVLKRIEHPKEGITRPIFEVNGRETSGLIVGEVKD